MPSIKHTPAKLHASIETCKIRPLWLKGTHVHCLPYLSARDQARRTGKAVIAPSITTVIPLLSGSVQRGVVIGSQSDFSILDGFILYANLSPVLVSFALRTVV
jgi:hypothetical protein